MFFEKSSIEGLIESYVQLGAWNIHIQSLKIIKRIRSNTFIARLKLKKRNFFTSAREAIVTINYFKNCECLAKEGESKHRNKHFLMFSNDTFANQYLEGGVVQMNFNQIIEFSEIEGRPGVVFINLLSHIDFNVYEYLKSSVDLNLEFIQDLPSIGVVSRER